MVAPLPVFSMPLAFISNIMGMDGLVILVLGLLIFGSRLPQVGRNLGKTIVEFKKGLNGGYSEEEEVPPEPAPQARRPQSNARLTATPPAAPRKSLPTTEEV